MKDSVHIVGGGIIGLCSAYYLNKAGFSVTVIDRGNISDGTSFGNAGLIVPSHFVPLAAPGVIKKGVRWMFDPGSPFYIRPRASISLAQWLWRFYRSCNKEHLMKSASFLHHYNAWSKDLYREICTELPDAVDFREKGLLMLYRTESARKEEEETADLARKMGIKAEVLDPGRINQLNPEVDIDVIGGVFYPDDAQVYSNRFMAAMYDHLGKHKVRFIKDTEVEDLKVANGKIDKIVTSKNRDIKVDHLVISAGAWSTQLLKKIGIKLLQQDGKGYSITTQPPARPSIPCILTGAKVAMTPMGNELRITGTLEISNLSRNINLKRVKGFLSAVRKYFPEIKINSNPSPDQIWTGYRPCSPDGIPYLGKSKKYDNLIIATGHAMMGMSLGPASGRLISQILCNDESELDLKVLSPDRTFGT